MRNAEFYRENDVDLLGVRATAIDTNATLVRAADGDSLSYGALLIATGAEPVRLDISGAGLSHVHYLRSLADSHSIVQAAEHAKNAVVIGASFIGLEVAASLRARNVHVDVVAPGRIPMERILGREIGAMIRKLHEDHGVQFHLPGKVRSLKDHQVVLQSNETLDADLVVVGIGVRPSLGLAELPWTAASPSTGICGPAFLGSLRQATSHVGPIRTQGRRFASSTGLSPNDRARLRRVT